MGFPEYKPFALTLIIPDFDTEIADLVIDLDHLRKKEIHTRTHPLVFRDLLSNHTYLGEKIIHTSLVLSEKEKRITSREKHMLKIAFDVGAVSATHYRGLFRDKTPQEISRRIRSLRSKDLLISLSEGSRKYVINLKAGLLRPGIMEALDQQGFLPPQLPVNP